MIKKLIIIAVVLLSTVFYISANSFKEVGNFDYSGVILNNNSIQTYLYSGELDLEVEPIRVDENDTIYERWSTVYVGEQSKKKINDVYPMLIKDGVAIKFLNNDNTLFDSNLNEFKAYKNLIINNGDAFNNGYERADDASYVLARLTNNIYVNTQKMSVETYLNSYTIKSNSYLYMTPNYIRIYSFDQSGKYVGVEIEDVDIESIIKIGDLTIRYGDLLQKIGEISIEQNSDSHIKGPEDKTDENIIGIGDGINGTNGNVKPGGNKDTSSMGQGSSGSGGGSAPQRGGEAKPAENPDESDGSLEPEDQKENPDNNKVETPKNPEWIMPTIKLSNVYVTSAYTVRTSMEVEDIAAVIRNSAITFEITNLQDGDQYYGKVEKRVSLKIANGNNDLIIAGLSSNKKYGLKAYYYFYDNNKHIVGPEYLVEDVEIVTGDLSQLGSVVFKPLNTDNIAVHSDYISSPALTLDIDNSGIDAVGGISYISAIVNGSDGSSQTFKFTDDGTARIQAGLTYNYASPHVLKPGVNYDVTIQAYDKDRNVLNTVNNTYSTRTCLELPTVKINLTKPELQTVKVGLDINDNGTSFTNLKAQLLDNEGNVYKYNGYDFSYFDGSYGLTFSSLGLNKNYTIKVYLDADNNDGNGVVERLIATKAFNTGELSALGKLVLDVKDETLLPQHNLSDVEEATTALISVGISNKTNSQLLNYIDTLSLKLDSTKDTFTYHFSDEEISKLKNGENILIDTRKFTIHGLTSNTYYSLLFEAKYMSENDPINIQITNTLSRLKTPKMPVVVEMKNVKAYEGFISSQIRITDVDNLCAGDSSLLRVYKVNENGRTSLVGSFRITKDNWFDLNMFSDGDYSSDGNAYNIEADTEYLFKFVAEVANLPDGTRENYTYKTISLSTEKGITGDIYLESLDQFEVYRGVDLPEGYIQLEYIESVGGQFIKTGVIPKESTNVELKWQSSKITGAQTIFGSSWAGNAFMLDIQSSRYYWHGQGIDNGIPSTTVPDVIKVGAAANSFVVNGNRKNVTKDTLVNASSEIKLFGLGATSYSAYGRMYSFKIYEAQKLVRDYIPCINTEGKIGLYDTIGKKFYGNDGTKDFIAGGEVTPDVQGINPEKQYLANLGVKIKEYQNESGFDFLNPNIIYADVYRTIGNVTEKQTDTPIQIEYDDLGGTYHFTYPVDKDRDTNNYYSIDLFAKLQNPDGSELTIPLDTVSFKTAEPVYTISTIDELFAIASSNASYVVVNDLSYYMKYKGVDDTTTYNIDEYDEYGNVIGTKTSVIHWRNGGNFNAKVDFQGYSLDLGGYGPFIYQTTRQAEIRNIVVKMDADLSYSTGQYTGYGNFIGTNYGLIENILFEYSQVQPEDIEGNYLYGTYWTTEPDDIGVTHYVYMRASGITYNNYGKIRNFVINLKTNVKHNYSSGYAAAYNGVGSSISNGYLYSSKNDYDENNKYLGYKANIDLYGGDWGYGAIVGYNETGASIENVYALANIRKVNNTSNNVGIISGRNYGIVRNVYAVGDTLDNVGTLNNFKGAATSYGPAVGYTTTGYVNRNIYHISQYSYTSANSYNVQSVASILAIRNATWQNSILNGNVGSFNVDDLIDVSCYPQVNYSTELMPIQDYLEFEDLEIANEVDVVYSYAYTMGTDPGDDLIFNNYIKNSEIFNEDNMGNLMSDVVGENGLSSQWQPVIFVVSDKSAMPVLDINVSGIEIDYITHIFDGDGVTKVYGIAYNPSTAVNNYTISSIKFGHFNEQNIEISNTMSLNNKRYLQVTWFRTLGIEDVNKWIQYLHNAKAEVKENIILLDDINFQGYKLSDIMVTQVYSGTFDGNGHKLYGFEYENLNPTTFGLGNNAGIFRTITGATIKDLTIEGLHYEGGAYATVLAGTSNAGIIDNVHIKDCSLSGSTSAAGLVGAAYASTKISNSSVTNLKINLTGRRYTNTWNIAGGLIASMEGLTQVDSCFVQDIYIENWEESRVASLGGLVGTNQAGYSEIKDSYATGVINGVADGMGGILGVANGITVVDDCYADVDLITYNGGAGGIIGKAANSNVHRVTNVISYGNIISGAVFKENDQRLNNNSLTNIDSDKILAGEYYENATFDLTYLDSSKELEHFNTASLMVGKANFEAEDGIIRLDSSKFISKINGTLPFLVNEEGELEGQYDKYISDVDSPIKLLDYSYSSDKLTFRIQRDPSIEILDVYTDYTYVDQEVGLGGNGSNSMTKHKAFDVQYGSAYKSTEYSGSNPVDTIVYSNAPIISKYDTYKVTAIKYRVNGETHFLKVNKLFNIEPQFNTISNINEWENFFVNKGSFMENFNIAGDIDFAGKTLNYNAKYNIFNVIVNRMIGFKKADDYKSIYEGRLDGEVSFPYYAIKNAEMNNISIGINEGGVLFAYEGYTGVIKTSVSELANLSFNNNKITKSGAVGVIGSLTGDAYNLTFTNNSVKGTSSVYTAGMIAQSSANIHDVYVGNSNVQSSYADIGGLVGFQCSMKANTGINRAIVENTSVLMNTNNDATGGIAGASSNDNLYFYGTGTGNYSAATGFSMSDCIVSNVSVSGGNNFVGGVSGRAYYGGMYRNNLVTDSTIASRNGGYVGGITGYVTDNNARLVDCTVNNTTISGKTNYVGGLSGFNGYADNSIVDDCIIYNKGGSTGGLWGYISGWADKPDQEITPNADIAGWVKNTKVYGNNAVGGIAGNCGYYLDTPGFVENCEIYGNTQVGGAIGYSLFIIYSPHVSNTIVAPLKANNYGITVSTSPTYFGGLLGYGGRIEGFVEDSVIGGPNVTYVGGIAGRASSETSTYHQNDAICRDSVVIGDTYVSGMYGSVFNINSNLLVLSGSYSNATVIGNDVVTGVASYVSGYVNSNVYLNIPRIEYSYFTGTIKANKRASATLGLVYGTSEGIILQGVVSMPDSITGQTVEPIILDAGYDELHPRTDYLTTLGYKWTNLTSSLNRLKVSLWENTKINIVGGVSTTMKNVVLNPDGKYVDHVGNFAEVETDDVVLTSPKLDRKFILLYGDNGTHNAEYPTEIKYRQVELPTEYTQVDYIKSNGTQYIDTDYKPNSNTTAEYGLVRLSGGSGEGVWLWERYSNFSFTGKLQLSHFENRTPVETRMMNDVSAVYAWYDNYVAKATTYLYFAEPTSYSTKVLVDDVGTLLLNGEEVYANTAYSGSWINITLNFKPGWNEVIGMYKENGGNEGVIINPMLKDVPGLGGRSPYPVDQYTQEDFININNKNETVKLFTTDTSSSISKFEAKLYKFKLFEKGNLVRDYIPCKDSTGKYGLYDVITGTFKTADGFTGGDITLQDKAGYESLSIVYGINGYSLAGTSSLGTSKYELFTYTDDQISKSLMPFTNGLHWTNYSKQGIAWNGYVYSAKTNEFSDEVHNKTITQGVPIPGSNKYYSDIDKRNTLYSYFLSYMNNEITYEEFKKNTGLGNTEKVIPTINAYMVDTDIINIDLGEKAEAYQVLEYLESTGTQYILTDHVHNENTWIDMTLMYTSRYNWNTMIGAATDDNTNDAMSFGTGQSYSFNLDVGKNATQTNTATILENQKYHIVWTFDKAIVDGVTHNYAGVPNSTIYKTELFGRNLKDTTFTNEIGKGRFYGVKIYTGSFNDTEHSSLECEFVPVRRGSDGVFGMFDKVSNKFYPNKGTGTFIPGPAKNTVLYNTTIKITDLNTGTVLLPETDITTRTYSIKHDLSSDIKVEIKNKTTNTPLTSTIRISDVVNKVSTDNNRYSYIDANGVLRYLNASNNLVVVNDSIALNTYGLKSLVVGDTGNYLMDNAGNVEPVSTNRVLSTSVPITKFTRNSNDYFTYGTYTFIKYADGSEAVTNDKYYDCNGKLIVLKDNSQSAYDGVFAYGDNIEAYLKKSGVLKSIGTTDLTTLLKGFKNSDIKRISSNIKRNSEYLLVEYLDGSIVGYDVTNGNKVFSTQPQATLGASLMSFLMDGLNDLFSSPLKTTTASNRAKTNKLMGIMSSSNLSLNEVVDVLSDYDDIEEIVLDEKVGQILNNIGTNDGSSLIGTEGVAGDEPADGYIEENISVDILAPRIEGITDGTFVPTVVGETLISNKNLDKEYVAVYNGETDDFDIYSEKELIDNPQEPTPENYKVVDKSTLKSLYQALGERDKNNENGFVLYGLIVVVIILLVAIFVVIGKMNRLHS